MAEFIGAIGVLDRTQMDAFADIFIAFQKRGNVTDPDEKRTLDEALARWTSEDSLGKKRASAGPDGFSIKCVGVFDTVGSVGLPEEITIHPQKVKALFGFRDTLLGEHVQQAYQALALNETRKDFSCNRFHQTQAGRQKGQVLKQCWFTGCHSDIGGGYKEHDLSDITLTWMVANVGDMLSWSMDYIKTLPDPVAPWGEQKPHDPLTGVFSLEATAQRQLPTATNDVTHETIHPSVLRQKTLVTAVEHDIKQHPDLICSLLPLEDELKVNWSYTPGKKLSSQPTLSEPLSKIVTSDSSISQAVKDIINGDDSS